MINLRLLVNDLEKLASEYINKYFDSKNISPVPGKAHPVKAGSPDMILILAALRIDNPFISAPLAGISDNTYRIFAGIFWLRPYILRNGDKLWHTF